MPTTTPQTTTIPEPRTTDWGFWATMGQHAGDAYDHDR